MRYSVKYKGCVELNQSANGMTQSDRESLVNEGKKGRKWFVSIENQQDPTDFLTLWKHGEKLKTIDSEENQKVATYSVEVYPVEENQTSSITADISVKSEILIKHFQAMSNCEWKFWSQ